MDVQRQRHPVISENEQASLETRYVRGTMTYPPMLQQPRESTCHERTGYTLLVIAGADTGKAFPLERRRMTVGRNEFADIFVTERRSPRRRFVIDWSSLLESHGMEVWSHPVSVYLNGRCCTAAAHWPLKDGDCIQLGETAFSFRRGIFP